MIAAVDYDEDLEARIDAAYERMCRATELQQQKNGWHELVILVRQRSPAQLLRMENERRIAR